MKLCDGDCTIKKRNRQHVSFSSIFLDAHDKDARFYFKKRKEKKKKENTHLREEGRAPGFSVRESAGAASSL